MFQSKGTLSISLHLPDTPPPSDESHIFFTVTRLILSCSSVKDEDHSTSKWTSCVFETLMPKNGHFFYFFLFLKPVTLIFDLDWWPWTCHESEKGLVTSYANVKYEDPKSDKRYGQCKSCYFSDKQTDKHTSQTLLCPRSIDAGA